MLIKRLILTLILFVILLLSYVFIAPLVFKTTPMATPIISLPKIQTQSTKSTPTPTIIPIDENTNLQQEVKILTPEDFNKDFEDLNNQIGNF